MVARRLFLHIGAMKSGTSLVQTNLFANKSELASRGMCVPFPKWRFQVMAVSDVLAIPRMPAERREGRWNEMVGIIDEWEGDAVVSMEYLAAARPRSIERVVSSFPEGSVRVVLTGRDLNSALPSMWQETLKNGASWSWAEYRQAVRDEVGPGERFWRSLDLADIVENWAEAVGLPAVSVVTVPRPGGDREELWRRFCSVLGVDPAGLRNAEVANASLGLESSLMLLELNKALEPLGLPFAAYAGKVKHAMSKKVLTARAAQEHRLAVPVEGWLRDRSDRMVERLVDSGVAVVGDLAELEPREIGGVSVDDVDGAAVLGAAQAALAGAVLRMVRPDTSEVSAP